MASAALIATGLSPAVFGQTPKTPEKAPSAAVGGESPATNSDASNNDASVDSPPGEASAAGKPRDLVAKLGSESFDERRAAETQLREFGLDARDALQQGLSSDDLQIRRTCQRLLNDILESDYQRRLSRFVDDPQGKLEHDLPGWERYRQIAGDDAAARRLFAEMHQAEGALLISTEAGKVPMADALDIRYRSVYQMMRLPNSNQRVQPSLATVSALMFVAADPRLDSDVADDAYWSQITNSPLYRQGLTSGETKEPGRKVLGQWIALSTGPRLLNQKLRMAIQYEIPEGLGLALETIENRNGIPPSYASYAIEAVGKLGGKPYAARLAPLLKETSAITRQRVNKVIVTIELRDVALGWLIHLTGQDHEQYHLPRAKPIFQRMAQNPANYSVSYSYMRFDNTVQRDEAFAKWNAYVEKHPLPEPPKDEGAPRDEQATPAAAGK
ncbi:MAG: hypothetical protein RIC55_05130 [Pirellulaceae bacterium]